MATYRVRIRATRLAPTEVAITVFRRVDAASPAEAATAVGRMVAVTEPTWSIERLYVASENSLEETEVFVFDGEQAQPLA
jgi:hypothetical protein